jgi:hypothetical protein
VTRDGYVLQERRITITAARASQSLTFTLAPERAAPAPAPAPAPAQAGSTVALVLIESRPAGASVFLDGRLVGTTPLQVGDVTIGNHQVALALDGYSRWTATIDVEAGEQRIRASLDRADIPGTRP